METVLLEAVNHLQQADPVLKAVINEVGPCRITYREPTFPALVRSIVFQQLNGKAASTMAARLEEAAGRVTPENILRLTPEAMRALGLSQQKLSYIRDLAQKTLDGAVRFEVCPAMSDDEVVEHLTQVKGIGVWTAHMFLMFALRRPDVLPVGDYGIRAAMKKHYRMRKLPEPDRMRKVAAKWRPYSSVACWYLWRSLDGPAE